MPKLQWDVTGQKKFHTGTKNTVLFVMGANGQYQTGVAWSGITGVTVSNTGGDETALWADDTKYGSLRAAEECGGTIEAYDYPREFYPCDGVAEIAPGVYVGQQNRTKFALAFVTTVGNDTEGLDHGYIIHLIYGASASPSEKAYTTINDSPDASNPSWEFTTTPIPCADHKNVAHLEIDSTAVDSDKLTAFENILYGTDAEGQTEGTSSRLLLPDEVANHFKVTQSHNP